MTLTLAIDAAAAAGSVAVLRDGRVVAERAPRVRGERADRLLPAVAEVLGEAGATVRDVDRVVCGSGPGSFTGLRIAASIAKGIAVGVSCPLFAIPSLALIAAGAEPPLPAGRYLALLDAMRGECFAAEIEVAEGGEVIVAGEARVAAATEIERIAKRLGATPIGAGAQAGRDLLPHARGLARLQTLLAERPAVDLALWEPDYGRKAEAQVRWEAAHGRPLPSA